MSRTQTLIGLFAALAALAASASAQTARHRHRSPVVDLYAAERPPLTVSKRSYLDPGPVAPVGAMPSYVAATTIFHKTQDELFARSEFGNEVLPHPLEVPGRPSPIFEFATPGSPYGP
jgi:hypothetical protein